MDDWSDCEPAAYAVHPFTRSALAIDLLRPQLRDDRGEVLEVVDFEIDGDLGEVRRLPRHADIVDIAVVLGDDLRDLRERAGLVHRLHGKPGRESAAASCRPRPSARRASVPADPRIPSAPAIGSDRW